MISILRPDATIKSHENKPDNQEKLITIMEITETGVSEDRIATLEKKVREMEALVKGLVQELLDLKSISMTMTRESEVRSRQELKRGPIVQGTGAPGLSGSFATPSISSEGSTVIRPKGSRQPDVPAAPAEPEMVRIMQNDGTMKMEPRSGSGMINSSGGYGRNKAGAAQKTKQAPMIYAADEEKSDSAKK